jgi:hypothetical protein
MQLLNNAIVNGLARRMSIVNEKTKIIGLEFSARPE